MGVEDANIFISEIGKVLEIDSKGARYAGVVPAGQVLIDGYGVGDVGNIVLRDRKLLSQDGLIVVVATVALQERAILSGPEIVSRGFVYVRESEEMMDAARKIATAALRKALESRGDFNMLKNSLRDELSRFFFTQTKRSPMILPIVMEA
jgi:ribonuclease J